MTEDEKKEQMIRRNAAICAYYKAGHKLSECASNYGVGRQRALQILKQAGVWKPYVKGNRTEFLGVSVTDNDKIALKAEAERRGISMSSLTSDLIKDMLAAREVQS